MGRAADENYGTNPILEKHLLFQRVAGLVPARVGLDVDPRFHGGDSLASQGTRPSRWLHLAVVGFGLFDRWHVVVSAPRGRSHFHGNWGIAGFRGFGGEVTEKSRKIL